MCGIAGLWRPGGAADELAAQVRAMADALAHRGPDDAGVWVDPAAALAFGHRRLSIIDVSATGHQPMLSADGRFAVTYNGEIYNFLELRRALEAEGRAPAWRGQSDTEVLLAAVCAWGLEAALKRFTGMFALALWDARERILHLARDRLGEKPLYYGWAGSAFLFGSELKAMKSASGFSPGIDRSALALYARYGNVPAPHSIYEEVRKLPAGAWLSINAGQLSARSWPEPRRYWSLAHRVRAGKSAPFKGTERAAVDELEHLLGDAVRAQMVADVPLGAFLSGGVDSSTIVALMQKVSGRPVKTFTIGFPEERYNEAPQAGAVAAHLGTEHTELYVTPREAMDVIPRLPEIYDEPFADSSQIPTFLVSRLARSRVTVSLSGDGGDELFGGYNRYFWGPRLWRWIGAWPTALRSAAAGAVAGLQLGDRAAKLARLAAAGDEDDLYERLVSLWHPANPAGTPPAAARAPLEGLALEERMMYYDAAGYLPDDILAKVDRAAMAVSLETRVPLLDHRVVEFAWTLPLNFKIRGRDGKWLLRQVLERHVPRALLERPRKMGFSIPLEDWLRGELREWADALLEPARLSREGYFEPAAVQRCWREHLSGRRNWQHRLWAVLMFGAWLEREKAAA